MGDEGSGVDSIEELLDGSDTDDDVKPKVKSFYLLFGMRGGGHCCKTREPGTLEHLKATRRSLAAVRCSQVHRFPGFFQQVGA